MRRVVAVNERGLRIGEDHQCAKLTNAEVELMLELREQGWSYRRLALSFEISKSHARYIVKGRWRSQCAMGWKTLAV